MAKKSTPPTSARQAKIQAAQHVSGAAARTRSSSRPSSSSSRSSRSSAGSSGSQSSSRGGHRRRQRAAARRERARRRATRPSPDVTPGRGRPDRRPLRGLPVPGVRAASRQRSATDDRRTWRSEGKIKLVYHVKNFLDDNLGNDSSTRAGNAAFCAADAGKFQEFHDQVFPNQPAQEGDGFTDAAAQGLRGDGRASPATRSTTWQQCVRRRQVRRLRQLGARQQSFEDGVRGTPTVKINGEERRARARSPRPTCSPRPSRTPRT